MATNFKDYEKLFKKFESPEVAVIEGNAVDFEGLHGYQHVKNVTLLDRECKILSIDGFDGSYVIPDALSRGMQMELARHFLSDCLQKMNKTNLHGHTETSLISSQLSDIWARESVAIDELKGDPCPKLPKSTILSKIRWVTLGYQYDWTARKYVKEQFVPFNQKLFDLCSKIGDLIGSEYSIKADAAIVNFYPEGAVMGGHIDDAETTYDHPVISISIGCPCLFLLGGFDKEACPLPMILRSGDILIMGGKSRLRVHAVPKVFTKSLPPSYLHPRSAGSAVIHSANCSHFLESNQDKIRCKSSLNSSSLMQPAECKDICDSVQITSLKRNISKSDLECSVSEETTDGIKKKYKCDDRADLGLTDTAMMTGGRDNDCYKEEVEVEVEEEEKIEEEVAKETGINGSQSCCSLISVEEELRVLRFLQTTRINFNVRQVYSDPLVTQ